MLAELNGPVPRISLKIDLVVSVIIKDLPQAVYRPYRFDSLVGNTGEGFAVGIVPACPWHKGINQVFEMLVGQSQILPGVQPSQPDDIGGVALPERETEIIF